MIYAIPGGRSPTPLAAYATVGRGRVVSVPGLFPVAFEDDIDAATCAADDPLAARADPTHDR